MSQGADSIDEKVISADEVAGHNTEKDLWLVIHGKVYDATKFVPEHPGGSEILTDVGGQDATEAFEDVGHSDEARDILKTLLIGTLKGGNASALQGAAAAAGAPISVSSPSLSSSPGSLYVVAFILVGILSALAYRYLS